MVSELIHGTDTNLIVGIKALAYYTAQSVQIASPTVLSGVFDGGPHQNKLFYFIIEDVYAYGSDVKAFKIENNSSQYGCNIKSNDLSFSL